jgi:hypothetical protein
LHPLRTVHHSPDVAASDRWHDVEVVIPSCGDRDFPVAVHGREQPPPGFE